VPARRRYASSVDVPVRGQSLSTTGILTDRNGLYMVTVPVPLSGPLPPRAGMRRPGVASGSFPVFSQDPQWVSARHALDAS